MVLIDTHVLLWWQADGSRLSARADQEIARADRVLVSPVSCWETAVLLRKGRIALDRDIFQWLRDLFGGERVDLAPLSASAAAAAGLLEAGFPGDPADRMLYATARELAVSFVTKDTAIRAYAREQGDVRAVW